MKVPSAKYNRIVLKLSGEALMGKRDFGIDDAILKRVARQVKDVTEAGVEVAIVVGGGNIWRGADAAARGMDRATAAPALLGSARSVTGNARLRGMQNVSIAGSRSGANAGLIPWHRDSCERAL